MRNFKVMRLAGFILILTSISTLAQPKPLFKIISCSEGVTVDGVEAKPGEIIFSNSDKLNIPKGGYAGVITLDGYVYQFLKGISVKRVPESVRYNVESRSRTTEAVLQSMPKPFPVLGSISNEFSEVYGDTLLIAVKSNYKENPPFRITFFDMFDRELKVDTLRHLWKSFNLNEISDSESAFIFNISSKQHRGDFELVKKVNPTLRKKVEFDLNWINDPISRLALFEINKLHYDQIYQLFKLETSRALLIDDSFLLEYFLKTQQKFKLIDYLNQK